MAEARPTTETRSWFQIPEHLLDALIFETFGDQRYTQDSPIMPEVWIAYAHAPRKPIDILLTPRSGDSPSQLATRVARRLTIMRGGKPETPTWEKDNEAAWEAHNIAYSRSSVVVSATFHELICVIVPMTIWWAGLKEKEGRDYFRKLRGKIEQLASENLNLSDIIVDASRIMKRSAWDFIRFCALVGLIALNKEYEEQLEAAEKRQKELKEQPAEPKRGAARKPRKPVAEEDPVAKLNKELNGKLQEFILGLSDGHTPIAKITDLIDAYERLASCVLDEEEKAPLKIFMITQNRDAHLSIAESRATIKADAANNVFHIDTSDFSWAVIDGGIDARHPAFLNRKATKKLRLQQKMAKEGPPSGDGAAVEAAAKETEITDDTHKEDIPFDLMRKLSRVRESYDFTYLRKMLATKRLPSPEDGGPSEKIAKFISANHGRELEDLKTRTGLGREIDWQIVAPLIRVPHDENYDRPTIGHGTHVAGIIGADWRAEENSEALDLVGICPQIQLYDLRVFRPDTGSDEFTVQYALQFVQHLNLNRELPRVHGVNLSLSMLHKVMSFACGRTPVCDECNDLVGTGVVVVVAAGNDGYKTFKTDKGNYSGYHTASITDPGNAADVITVGSTHRSHPHNYGVSYFSSRGPTGDGRRKPDLVAPGEKITAPVVACGVQRMDGTSMAAPHVSGAAALLMSRHRELIGEPRRIKEILCSTATDLGREPHFQGAGMVDILRALQSI